MARPVRIDVEGCLYHVMARGNERRAIFRDERDRERYLERLAHYREKFGFRLLAYCLMDNHVHLAMERGKGPLSRIMAGLQSSYTQWGTQWGIGVSLVLWYCWGMARPIA